MGAPSAPGAGLRGGLGGCRKFGLSEKFFLGQCTRRSAGVSGSYADRLDRSRTFKPAHRGGIGRHIGQGTIVNSGGYLGARLLGFVGYSVGKQYISKEKGLRISS